MKTYTISDPLKAVGQAFIVKPHVRPSLKPRATGESPPDVESVDLSVTTEETVEFVRQGRERYPRFLDE